MKTVKAWMVEDNDGDCVLWTGNKSKLLCQSIFQRETRISWEDYWVPKGFTVVPVEIKEVEGE